MKKFLKAVGIIALWLTIAVICPPLGAALLFIGIFIGLPIWAVWAMVRDFRKANPPKKRYILKTYIIGTSEKADLGSAVGRAVVGDFLAGKTGAFIGAMTGKNKTITRFLVLYDDESQEVVDVPDGSPLYNEYLSRLDTKG